MKETRTVRHSHAEELGRKIHSASLPENRAASFDATSADPKTMGDLKRLQDPAKFGRARFSFKLYKR